MVGFSGAFLFAFVIPISLNIPVALAQNKEAAGSHILDIQAEGFKLSYPGGWHLLPSRYSNAWELSNVPFVGFEQ